MSDTGLSDQQLIEEATEDLQATIDAERDCIDTLGIDIEELCALSEGGLVNSGSSAEETAERLLTAYRRLRKCWLIGEAAGVFTSADNEQLVDEMDAIRSAISSSDTPAEVSSDDQSTTGQQTKGPSPPDDKAAGDAEPTNVTAHSTATQDHPTESETVGDSTTAGVGEADTATQQTEASADGGGVTAVADAETSGDNGTVDSNRTASSSEGLALGRSGGSSLVDITTEADDDSGMGESGADSSPTTTHSDSSESDSASGGPSDTGITESAEELSDSNNVSPPSATASADSPAAELAQQETDSQSGSDSAQSPTQIDDAEASSSTSEEDNKSEKTLTDTDTQTSREGEEVNLGREFAKISEYVTSS